MDARRIWRPRKSRADHDCIRRLFIRRFGNRSTRTRSAIAMRVRANRMVMVAAVAAAIGLSVERGETHKPITSKYTYNEDVFPILRDHCGRCHVAEGIAPMSLMTYMDAFPWGEAVRAEVIAGHMPPWHAEDGVVRFKNAP